MDVFLGTILIILFNLYCVGVGSSNEPPQRNNVELVANFFSTISDFNADFVLVSKFKNDCAVFENAFRVSHPGILITCLDSEIEIIRMNSSQSEHLGFIFTNPIGLNSTDLQKVGSLLSEYNNVYASSVNPFVFLTTMEDLSQNEFRRLGTSIFGKSFLLTSDIYIINYKMNKLYEMYLRKDLLITRQIHPTLQGIHILNDKVRRRANLMGSTVVATTVDEDSYKKWVNLSATKELESGFSVVIYKDLKYMLNFTESVVIGDWIQNNDSGALFGKTFDQLSSGVADISITQQSVLAYRAKELQFLQPTYQGMTQAFFKQPETSAIRNIVTVPFQTAVWVGLGLTWLIVIISVKIIVRLRGRSNLEYSSNDTKFSKELVLWAVAATCQKSWYVQPACTSVKMTFLIGYILGVLCYVAYSAAIVSALAIAIIPIKEFDDLRSFKYIFTAHELSHSTAYFLQELIKTYKLNQQVKTVNSEDEIPHLLKVSPRHAMLSSEDNFFTTAYAENNTVEFLCSNINQVPVGSVPLKTGMFLRKGSDMTEIFNYKIIMLKERGLNLRYMQDYNELTGLKCDSGDKLHQAGLGIPDIFTAFLIIIIGSGIGFGVIIAEILYSRIRYDHKYPHS